MQQCRHSCGVGCRQCIAQHRHVCTGTWGAGQRVCCGVVVKSRPTVGAVEAEGPHLDTCTWRRSHGHAHGHTRGCCCCLKCAPHFSSPPAVAAHPRATFAGTTHRRGLRHQCVRRTRSRPAVLRSAQLLSSPNHSSSMAEEGEKQDFRLELAQQVGGAADRPGLMRVPRSRRRHAVPPPLTARGAPPCCAGFPVPHQRCDRRGQGQAAAADTGHHLRRG
jgi:hypothetical protein